MNSVVDCFSIKDGKWTDIDISTDFDVYPCCAYHGAVYERNNFEDERLNKLSKGWNNLKNNSLENILKKYSEVINHENWSDEKSCLVFVCDSVVKNNRVKDRHIMRNSILRV